jgi:uncharacterized Zn finger protein (UPF0148 family)
MNDKCCVVCGRPTSDGIVVCPSCGKGLGEPKRARTEDAILSFKVERRRRS